MTPEQHRLIHFGTVASVVRFTVDELRLSYNPEFRTAHLQNPAFDEVRETLGWYAHSFTQDFCAKHRAENFKDILRHGARGIENIWKRVGLAIDCPNRRGDCDCRAVTGQQSEILGLTADEQTALADTNAKMRLAITVGYILCALKAGKVLESKKGSISLGEISDATQTHLQLPMFAKLPKSVMDWIKMEIFEFVKDGLLNSGVAFIDAAQIGDHAHFWEMSNVTIGAGMPIDPLPISPELLPEELFPAPEIIMTKKENALLHLALAVGYARLCQKRAVGADAVTSVAFAKAHLELPAFSGLSSTSRAVVADELLKLSDDGNGTSDQGAKLIEAAMAGNYLPCWRLANKQLAAREPSYAKTVTKRIEPHWLV